MHHFRNYAEEEFTFAPGVNIISGENAQGKTNLLEAAAALSTMKLFRTGQKKEGLPEEEFTFAPGVNIISGENAQGKTNLLEAAAALSTMKLFRTGQKKEGLQFGEKEGSIIGSFEAENREFAIALRLFERKAAEVWRNGVRMKRQGDARGILKTVLFCPDDLYLIRAGASARRRFLDPQNGVVLSG